MVLIHEALADGGLLLQWHVNAALYTRGNGKVAGLRRYAAGRNGWPAGSRAGE